MTDAANQVTSEGEPPEVDVQVLAFENLPEYSERWENIKENFLPADFLLLTVKDCELLSCLSFLEKGFVKGNQDDLGYVYFGIIRGPEDEEGKVAARVAVMRCNMGSSTPGGSLVTVPNAVRILRPKAVLNVGFCASVNEQKAKLGDVVVCSEIITNASRGQNIKAPLDRLMGKFARDFGSGWKPPVKNSTDPRVKAHRDCVFLSVPEVIDDKERRDALIKQFPKATAIEMEGQGLYVAAHELNIPWIVIKGVSDFADGNKSKTNHWRSFASVMAASLVAHTIKDPVAFKSWPHFEDRKRQRSSSPSGSDRKRNKSTAGESNAEDAQPGPSNQGEPRSTRPGDKAPTTYKDNSNAEDGSPRKRRRSSSSPSGSDPKRNKATAGAPQEPSTRRGRRSTRSSGNEPRATQDNSDAEDGSPRKKRRSSSSPSGSDPNRNKSTAVENGKPSYEELERISKKIGKGWRPLGRRLNFEETELDAFDENHKEFTEKAYQMLLHWKRREDEEATYLVLHDALCHDLVDRKDLANNIYRQ